MREFDVVIVGAGPAGGHCARVLSKLGYQVLLLEQHESFTQNIFSSAATPLETLQRFDLPRQVAPSAWHNLEIVTTNVRRSWSAPNVLGVVFDFAQLRAFLAKDAQAHGAQVWLGHRYVKSWQVEGKTFVSIKPKGDEPITVATRLLVDATGFARAVIYPQKRDKPEFLKGTGIEYLIEVDASIYQRYAATLVFFLGYKWSPKGYSWIFPMANNQLKVGSAWLDAPHKFITSLNPLKFYVKQIIEDFIQTNPLAGGDSSSGYKILDIHGSILEYSVGLNDIYYKNPNIIAIGDAVSTVNFLGGEGIRHAMQGAEIAVKYIQEYLNTNRANFDDYQQEMRSYFAAKWNVSAQISQRVYLEYSDHKIDQGVSYLKYLNIDDIIDILFNYKFEKFTRGLNGYLKKKVGKWIEFIRNVIINWFS